MSRHFYSRTLIICAFLSLAAHGQTISVDATPSHMRKSFVPNQALGAGIDRMNQTIHR